MVRATFGLTGMAHLLRLRSRRRSAAGEVSRDVIGGLLFSFLVFFSLPFRGLASRGQVIVFAFAVDFAIVVPNLATVIGIPKAIVIDNKIVLIQTLTDYFFVSFLIHFIEDIFLFFDLVCGQPLLASSTQSSQLLELCATNGRHNEKIILGKNHYRLIGDKCWKVCIRECRRGQEFNAGACNARKRDDNAPTR